VFGRLFQGRTEPDGASAVLEEIVTGVPPALLEPEIEAPIVAGRRDRVLEGGQRVLMDSMAEKVLHGWLQNRHQTLFPLTVNLRTLDGGQAATLAQWTAVAALATGDAAQAETAALETRNWLASVGADAASLAALDAAITAPPALDRTLVAVAIQGLSAYAYVAALIATDPRDAATPPFLDYVAARLALPTTVVRSATRRYRR
jgi:uncharacterized membrane protein YebE (DUF533 family)